MRTSRLRIVAVVAMLLAAIVLFLDANTFTMFAADPVTGKGRGCYTILERLLGVQGFSYIRGAEFWSAIFLIPAGFLFFRWHRATIEDRG
jgi:hypothetical protein